MDPAAVEAAFEQVRAERFLRSHLDEARSPDFWRQLNPHLTISDDPFGRPRPQVRVSRSIVDRAAAQLVEEGYFHTPPLAPPEALEPLRLGVERVVTAGFPSPLACVYDEYYQLFQGLDELFVPLLGERYLLVLFGLWIFFVPPGDPGYRRWGALAAHRDALGPDPAVVAGRLPAFLNIWIPLTTVTPLDSCLYVVPANRDADYRSNEPAARQERIRLQDVRAVPADAGSVIGWSTHLVHWGSASSRFAVGPRVSATMNLQRRDVPPFHSFTIDFNRRVPFDDRLAWIDDSMGAEAGLLQRTP